MRVRRVERMSTGSRPPPPPPPPPPNQMEMDIAGRLARDPSLLIALPLEFTRQQMDAFFDWEAGREGGPDPAIAEVAWKVRAALDLQEHVAAMGEAEREFLQGVMFGESGGRVCCPSPQLGGGVVASAEAWAAALGAGSLSGRETEEAPRETGEASGETVPRDSGEAVEMVRRAWGWSDGADS